MGKTNTAQWYLAIDGFEKKIEDGKQMARAIVGLVQTGSVDTSIVLPSSDVCNSVFAINLHLRVRILLYSSFTTSIFWIFRPTPRFVAFK